MRNLLTKIKFKMPTNGLKQRKTAISSGFRFGASDGT